MGKYESGEINDGTITFMDNGGSDGLVPTAVRDVLNQAGGLAPKQDIIGSAIKASVTTLAFDDTVNGADSNVLSFDVYATGAQGDVVLVDGCVIDAPAHYKIGIVNPPGSTQLKPDLIVGGILPITTIYVMCQPNAVAQFDGNVTIAIGDIVVTIACTCTGTA